MTYSQLSILVRVSLENGALPRSIVQELSARHDLDESYVAGVLEAEEKHAKIWRAVFVDNEREKVHTYDWMTYDEAEDLSDYMFSLGFTSWVQDKRKEVK